MDNTNERIKLIQDHLAQSVEDYGDYELAKIDSEDAYWLISTIKQQQREIERYKSLVVSTNANGLEKRVESERSWFANQTELIEEKHKLKQEIEVVTNLKKTLEEANHGMQRKIEEQQQEIEELNEAKHHMGKQAQAYCKHWDITKEKLGKAHEEIERLKKELRIAELGEFFGS